MILSDIGIVHQQLTQNVITPWVEHKVRMVNNQGVISFGLSSAGYDLRVSSTFKYISRWSAFKARVRCLLTGTPFVLDPKAVDDSLFVTKKAPYFDIPPWGFVLAYTVEYVDIPNDLIGILIGKSTYARTAVLLNTTPIEPGWRGHITVEISNLSAIPVRVWANEGIGQLLLCKLDQQCYRAYGNGPYQGQQAEIVHAKVSGEVAV